MLGVYLSIKTYSLTGRNISLFTIFDLSTPLSITVKDLSLSRGKHKRQIVTDVGLVVISRRSTHTCKVVRTNHCLIHGEPGSIGTLQ